MPVDICENCGNPYSWNWEEAFDKFGFNDGDGQVMTYVVESTLKQAGYEVESLMWGLHNVVISSICKDNEELMPIDDDSDQIGYDCPRTYLPKEITLILDRKLGA